MSILRVDTMSDSEDEHIEHAATTGNDIEDRFIKVEKQSFSGKHCKNF